MTLDQWKAALLTLGVALAAVAFSASGTVVDTTVHSPALVGNLLGDSADRAISVYLPPGYDEEPQTRYPVLYLLHGYTASNTMWFNGPYAGNINIGRIADALIASHAIQPLIIVMPDAKNTYLGSFYVNSVVTGNWEDFVATDLVEYVDTHYRTLARPESRAIAGHSMGGFGALYIATKHPETYRVVYAMTPYAIGLVGTDATLALSPFAFLATLTALESGTVPEAGEYRIAMAAAFSPNPANPPALVDLPYDRIENQPHRIDAVWERWIDHTPLAMVHHYRENLKQYSGIAFDVGLDDFDQDILIDVEAYSEALTQAGIPHRLELYRGNHVDQIALRLPKVVLPYISTHLEGSASSE